MWLKAEVIHADQLSLLVREEDNGMNIHTFTYSDKAREKIQAVLDAGGYQYGDKVKIRYMPGKTEALDIHGRPVEAALISLSVSRLRLAAASRIHWNETLLKNR